MMPEKLIAIVGSMTNNCAIMLNEILENLEGKHIGSCIIVDGLKPAITIRDLVDEYNAKTITIVGCRHGSEKELEIELLDMNSLSSNLGINSDTLVRALWPNLTGSTDPMLLADALRIIYDKPFYMMLLSCNGNEKCKSFVTKWLMEYCRGGELT